MAEREPIDYETPLGMVRLNITDTSEDPAARLLTDDQIRGLLAVSDGNTDRATARALRIIAASEVLVAKVIRTQDLSTNGDKVSTELRALAAEYDEKADSSEGLTSFAGYVAPGLSGRHEAEEFRLWPW